VDEKLDQAKGEVKEKVGQVTGDDDMEAEGKTDQAKGDVKEAWEKTKDAVDDIT
jgi:uncharacterized protein YjbJ (UPF0337 family)